MSAGSCKRKRSIQPAGLHSNHHLQALSSGIITRYVHHEVPSKTTQHHTASGRAKHPCAAALLTLGMVFMMEVRLSRGR
jgi:hypothetical protein